MTNFTRISLLMIFMFWTTGSTDAAISIEEEILQLKLKVTQLEAKTVQVEENDAKMKEKVTELESINVKMQEKVNELKAKVKEQDSVLTSLLQEKNERMKTNSDFAPISESSVAINGLPSSCGDLKIIGHTLNGFYSVMGLAMMESVYCDFTKLPSDAGFEKWIGYADVKSAPVHFYVQRYNSYSTNGTPIPFELARVNEGNAMNLATGTFTAPRNGIYFFSFTGLASFPASPSRIFLAVSLYLNGGLIGIGRVEESNNVADQFSPLTFQSTLNLKKDDKVWLVIYQMSPGVYLYDSSNHFTHFTGFLLQEEIVSSLFNLA